MSTAAHKRCFFLDSCVALAEILDENREVMEKFKTDVQKRGISCYLSDSVAAECDRKLSFSQTFFEKSFRLLQKYVSMNAGRNWGSNQRTLFGRKTFSYSLTYSLSYGKP